MRFLDDIVKRPESLIRGLRQIVTDLVALSALANELRTDHATFKTVVDEIKTNFNTLRSSLVGDYLVDTVVLSMATAKDDVKSTEFDYVINGVGYHKDAVDGTALTAQSVPQNKYGAWAFDIGADGTIDVVPATANATTGYDSAVLASGALPAVASDHVRMGYVTAMNTAGAFVGATTELDVATVTEAFNSATAGIPSIPSAIASSTPATLSAGAVSLGSEL